MRLAILGTGPGGYVAAIRAAQLGAEVTIIEKDEIGGTCLNWGCIPTKTLTASANALATVKGLGEYGIELKGSIVPDLSRIIDRKDKVVSTLVKGIKGLFKSWGIVLRNGRGMLLAPGEKGR